MIHVSNNVKLRSEYHVTIQTVYIYIYIQAINKQMGVPIHSTISYQTWPQPTTLLLAQFHTWCKLLRYHLLMVRNNFSKLSFYTQFFQKIQLYSINRFVYLNLSNQLIIQFINLQTGKNSSAKASFRIRLRKCSFNFV